MARLMIQSAGTKVENEPAAFTLPLIQPHQTRADQVRTILTQAIVEGRLAPGSLHSVQSLAAKLDVSRTPVREALIQLARHGMVQFVRNRGVRILEQSPRDVEEIFQIRRMLEVPCTSLAVRNATQQDQRRFAKEFEAMLGCAKNGDELGMWRHDRAFHRLLLECAGNRRLASYVDGLRDLVLTRGTTTAARGARSLVETAEAHRPILEAVIAGDGPRAANAMARHLERTEELLVSRSAEK